MGNRDGGACGGGVGVVVGEEVRGWGIVLVGVCVGGVWREWGIFDTVVAGGWACERTIMDDDTIFDVGLVHGYGR